MADLSHLLLAAVATAVHVALLLLAPLLAEIADATVTLLEGRTPPAPGHGWRLLAGRWGSAGGVAFPPATLAAFGCAVAAALLVPSFATGMLTSPIADLPLVALLLVAGRLAELPAASAPVALSRGLPMAVLMLPALLLASLALSLIAGGTGLDAAIAAAPGAAAVPLGLAVLSLAIAGVADNEADPEADLAGPGFAVAKATGQLRLMVWLDLVAGLLPPWSTTPSAAGPANWLAALLIWPVKVGLLAIGLGVCRVVLGAARSAWRPGALRAASLLALLGGVFVLIGQSFE